MKPNESQGSIEARMLRREKRMTAAKGRETRRPGVRVWGCGSVGVAARGPRYPLTPIRRYSAAPDLSHMFIRGAAAQAVPEPLRARAQGRGPDLPQPVALGQVLD